MFTVYLKPPLACSDGLPASYYAVLVVAKCHKTRGALPAIRSTSGSTQFRIFEIMASTKPCLSLSDIHLSLSFYIYIYVSHRRICRHVKSTCTIRISADYGNPFNGKSRIRVYKCVYTLAIQFRNLSRGLSCTVIVIDVSPRFFFPQMLQFPMNLSPTPRDRCIPWWYLCFSLETSPLVPRSFRGYPEISCRNPRSQRDPSNNFRFATWKLITNARETV